MAIFEGKNNLSAKKMMTHRANFSINALTLLNRVSEPTLETTQIKDLHLDERLFIGRIDEDNNPLFVKQSLLKTFGGSRPSNVGLNFVVDAFTDMKKKFDNDLNLGRINRNAPALTELTIKKSYINPFDSYNEILNIRIETFKNFVESQGLLKEIHDFDSFTKAFMDYIEYDIAPETPITRSMLFMSGI